MWSPSACGPEETAAPASGSARAAAPVEARRGHPGRRRCDPARGHFPRARGRTANVAGVGGSPPTPASTNLTTAPSGAECRRPDGGKHPADDTAPGRFPDTWRRGPGGRTRGAPDDPDAGYSREQALWVRDDLTNPPIGRRLRRSSSARTPPVVEFGLGFGRMDATTRAKDLRKMKRGATGLLLVAAVIFLLRPVVGGQRRARSGSATSGRWPRRAWSAALADWFAVTALFRRPLGLPIPHTAIIPTKKDVLGDSLGDFVGENFLAEDVVRDKLAPRRGRRAGRGVDRPARPTPTGSPPSSRRPRAASSPCCATTTCRRSSSRSSSASSWSSRSGPPLGTVLQGVLADGAHHRLVDLVVRPRLRLGHAATRRWCCGSSTSGRRAGRRGSSTTSSPTRCSPRCRTSPGR